MKNANETKVLPAGTVLMLCNTPRIRTGRVVAPRFGRSRRLKGYDVRTCEGELELWQLGEFFPLYEAEMKGRKALVSVPEDPDPAEILYDALHERLTLESMAVLINAIRVQINGGLKVRHVQNELKQLADLLVERIGGEGFYRRLCLKGGI